MNASTRNALRHLEQQHAAQPRDGAALPRWIRAFAPVRPRPLWQRAVAAVLALTMFMGPLSVTVEQSRQAAGLLAANRASLGDDAWQVLTDLAGLRIRFAMQVAQAAPIVDPRAPITFQPSVTQSTGLGGGVPVVNITAPNAAGISLNQYQSFNIDPVGLILNNSLMSGTSLTGGDVRANPNLGGRTASVIVNQVTSTGSGYASLLNGPLEVFGSPAAVVIANPNGITTRGAGFTNTIGVTLSTGAPQFLGDLNGTRSDFAQARAIGYDVTGGRVQIEGNAGVNGPGAGIEGTVGTIDLIGETIGVNAPLYAGNRINAVAGRQFVLPSASDATGTTYATAANGARNTADAIGAANRRAIDATAFGAMTAGQIQVISTAAGMGVRADAQLAANAGDLVLSSNGDVSIAGSAAQQQATIRANGQVEMRGAQLGVGGYAVQANGDVISTGTIQSGGKLDVTAGGRVALANAQAEADATIAGGPDVTLGDMQTNRALNVSARTGDGRGDIHLDGTVLSRDDTTLRADRDVAVAGQLGARAVRAEAGRNLGVTGRMQTTGDLALRAIDGDLTTQGPVASGGRLTLDAGHDVAAAGLLQAADDLRVRAGNNASVADTRVGGVLDLAAQGKAGGGDLTFNGVTQTTGATRLQSARDLTVNGTLTSGAALTVDAGRDLTVGGQGTVQASGDLALTARSGSVTSRGTLTGARDLTVNGGQDVALLGATGAIGAVGVTAGRDLSVGGTFAGRDGARLTAGRDATLGGTSAVSKDLAVEAARDLAVTGAALGAGVTLTGGRAVALNDVQSGGVLQVTARTGGLAVDGTVTSQASATLASGGDLAVRGALQSAERLSMQSGGGLSIDGKVHALATGDLSAARALDVRGVLQATGALDLASGGPTTIGGTVNALSSANLKSTGDVTVNGLLQSAGPLSVTGGAATTIGGTVLSTGDLALKNAAGSLTSTGTIAAGQDLRIDAAHTVDLGKQATTAQRDLTIHAGGDLRADGTVTAQRDGTLDAAGQLAGGGALGIGRAASLHSGGDTQLTGALRGDTVDVRADGAASLHDVQAASTLTLDAARDLRTTGSVIGNAEVNLKAGGDLSTSGAVQATRDLTLTAGRDLNATGALRTHQDLHVQAGNDAGLADAQVDGKLDAHARGQAGGGDLSFNGATQIAGATELEAARDLVVNGALTTGAALRAEAGRDVTVGKPATLETAGDLALTARTGNVTSQGVLTGARDVTVTAGQDVALAGTTRVFGEARAQAGRDLTVGGSLAGQGGARLTAGRDAVLGGTTGVLRDLTVDAVRDLAVTGAAVGAGVTLTGGGAVTLHDVQSNAALQVKARERGLTIDGAVTSLSSADLASGGDLAVHGALRSVDRANLTSGGALAVDGVLSTLSSATLKAAGDTTLNGVLQSAGAMSVTGGAATRIGGTVHSGGDLALTNAAGALTSTGAIEAGNDLRIDAARTVDLGKQGTTAQRDMTIHAGGDLRADGTVIAQRDGTLDAAGQLGGDGILAFGRAAELHSGGDTQLTGTLRGDTVHARADGAASLHDVLAVSAATLDAQRDLDLTGALRSGGRATLQAGANLGVTGALQTAGDASLTATQGRIATSGPLASNGALDLRAGTDITLAGATGAARGMTLEAARDIAATGALTGLSGDLRIGAGNDARVTDVQAGGTFHLEARGGDARFDGITAAVGLTEVKAARDVIVAGALAGGGDGASANHAATTVQAGRDVRVTGMLAGGAQLGVDAARDVSVEAAGHLQAAGDLMLAARAGGVTSTGTLAGERDVAINAARDLALTGKTSIGGDATLHAGQDLALGGTVTGKGGARLDAGQDVTLGGALGIARDVDARAGRDLAVTGALQGDAVTLTAARAIALNDVQSAGALRADARGGALRLDGTVNALGSGSLKSAGDLSLNGQLQTAGDLDTTSGGKTTLAGTLNTGAKASLDAAGDLDIGGALHATGPLLAKSGGALTVGGKVDSASSGALSAARDLTIDGTLGTAGALDLTSGGRTTLSGAVSSRAGGALHATGDVTVNGRLDTHAPLSITSGGNTTVGGALISGGDLTLRNAAGAFTSSGTLQADGALSIDAARAVDLGTGRTTALGDLDVTTRGDLTANGTVLAQGAGTLTAGGALGGAANLGFGKDATLRAGGDLNLTGALSGRAVEAHADGAATLHDVTAGGAMTLSAARTLTTTGTLDGKNTVALTAGQDLAQRGALQALGDATLTARQGRIDSNGPVTSGGALTLKAGTDIALTGTAIAGADTTLDAGQALTVTGALTSHGGLDAKAGTDLGIAGTVVVDHDATLRAARDLDVSGGIGGHGNGGVKAGRDLTGAGTIAFARTATLEAGRDVDQRGLIQGQRVQVTAAGGAAVKDIQADETLALSATGAQASEHAGDLRINGTATAGGAIQADAQRDMQVAGKLKGGATVEAVAQRNLNVDGAVQSAGDMTLSARAGDLTATGGINSGGALGAHAGQDLKLGATTSAVGDATLGAGRDLDLGAGLLIGDANGTLRAGRDLRGTGTQSFTQGVFDAAAGQDLALGGRAQARSVRAQGGRDATLHDVVAATTLDLIAQGKNGGGDATITGQASAQGAATLDAARDARVSGGLENGGAQTLNAQRDVIVSGTTQAKGDLKAHAVTGDVVLAGATTAGGTLALTSGQDTRLDAPVNATGATTIDAGRDLLINGTLAGQAGGRLDAARDIQGGGAIGFAREATLDAKHDVALSGTLQGASVAVTAGNQAGLGGVQALTGDLTVIARGGDATLTGPATAIGALSIQAARDARVDGAINAGGAATLNAARNVTTADVNAAGDLTLTATRGALQTGNLTTQHDLAATAGGALTVAGKTVAGGDARLNAGGDLTLKGDIGAQQRGVLTSGGALNAAAIAFGKEATLDAAGNLNASGAVTTNGKLTANAGGDLALGSVNAGGATELQARGANGAGDVNVNGAFVSGGATQITAARDAVFAGTVGSDGALSVTATRDLTLRDKVGGGGDVTLTATQGALRVDGALVAVGALKGSAGTALTLGAGTLVNGDTTLSAGGDMRFGGPMFGLGGATLKAGGAMTGGALTFAKAIDVDAGGNLTLGAIDGAATLNAASGGDMKLASASAVGQTTLTSRTGSVGVDGLLRSGGDARVQAARDVTLAGGVSAMGKVDVDAKGGDATVAGVSSNGDARIHANGKATLSGTSVTVGDLTVTGGDVVMKGSASSSRNLSVEAQRTLDAAGASLVASKQVKANGRDVTLGNVIAGALDAHADNQLTLAGETVGVVGAATLTSGNGLHNASKVLAGGGLTVSAQNLVNADKASLASTGATTLTAGEFTNAGLVNGATTQVNVSGGLNNVGGALMGVDALKVETGWLDNRNGVLFAGNANDPNGAMKGDLSLTIRGGDGALNNASGKLLAQRDIGINAANLTFDPTQGVINQRGQLSVTAGFVNIGGNWNYGGQGVTLTGQRGINNGGVMTGTAGLTLNTGGGAFNNYGQVSGSDVTLNGTLNNGGGAVMHADNVLTLNGNVTNRGTVEAGNVLNVSGWDYDNQGATTQSKGDVNFKLGGTLQNTGGSVFAGRNVNISAGAVINDQTAPGAAVTTTRDVVDPDLLWSGRVGTSTHSVYISLGGDHNYPHVDRYTIDASLGDLLSPTGAMSTRRLTPANCWMCFNVTGSTPVAGSGTVTFSKDNNVYMGNSNGNEVRRAKWSVGVVPGASESRTFVLPTVHETVTSQQPGVSGVISAGNAISLTAGTLSNRGGQIAAQGDISLNVQSLSNGAVAPTTLNQSFRQVDQAQYTEFLKQIVALVPKGNSLFDQLNPQMSAAVFVRGTASAVNNVPASTFQIDVNSAAPSSTGTVSSSTPTGLIAAGHDMTVSGGSLVNAGMLYAGRDVHVSAQNLSNQGGNQQSYSGQVGCAAGVPNSACGNAGGTRGNNPVTTGFSYNQSDATIYAGRDLVIAAGKVDNTYGNLLAGHDVVIGGVGTTANSTTPAQTLNNTSGNIIAGNDIKLNVSGAITNKLPPPVPVHENYGKQERYNGCMTAGGYKESYCEAYVDRQSGSTSVISAGNALDINAGALTNIGSLIAAGNSASIVVAGPVINEAQTLNAYWHSHWVQETGMFSSDKRHDIWACGSPEQCKALYGSAYTRTGGAIDPPTPVGNIAATIQAPNLSIKSNGQIQNVGNVIGTTVVLSGQKLINGITTPNTYTPHVNAPQQVITLSPLTLPGLNLSIPRAVGSGTLPTPVAGRAAYVNEGLGGSAIGMWSPQALLDNLPPSLQPGSTLFYYNPQEENLLLQQVALQQTGKASFVDGLAYDSQHGASVTEQEKGYLYQNAVDYAKRNNLQLGAALTQTQVNQLDRPMLWYVEQTFPDPTCTTTGTGVCPTITALMPQVYLPKDITAMSAGGNISGHDVTLKFNQDGQGSILNTGSITAGGTLSVETKTLTNRANEVNVGEIWQKVDGGYLKTTGTVVQPGGFMSAANMDLNVQALNQIGGALTKLGADGSVDEAGTKQVLADLQRQLGGNFAQTSVEDHLHQDFVKEGGAFGMMQIFSMAVAVAAAMAMQPYISAAIGSMSGAAAAATEAAFAAAQQGLTGAAITAAASAAGGSLAVGGLANTMIAVGLSSFASSTLGQFVGSGKIDLGSSFRTALISATTAGLTNGITFNAQTGMPGFSFNAPVEGVSSLASLSGVQNIGGSLVPKAGAAAGQLPGQLAALGANAAIQAGMGSLIGGEDFLDGLKRSLIHDAAAAGAFAIGETTTSGTLGNIAAHGALGCVAGAASGGGCESGALGGAASAAFTPDFIRAIGSNGVKLSPEQQAAVAAFATLTGGGLAGLTGVDMQGAIVAAQNEAINNSSQHLLDVMKHGGLATGWLQAAYTAMPWLPGNPVTQLMGSALKSAASQIPSQGGRKSPSDEDMLTGASNKGSNPLTSKSYTELTLESIRNGLGALVGMAGGGPLTPGASAVLVADAMGALLGAAAGATNVAGYGAGNTTLNSKSNDNTSNDGGGNSTFWSPTKSKTPVENAYDHSVKHGGEFPDYQNSVQYVRAAKDFVNNPPEGTLSKTRPNGDTLYYDPSSNTFAVKTKDGAPRTMYKPDPAKHGYPTNLDYFNAQK